MSSNRLLALTFALALAALARAAAAAPAAYQIIDLGPSQVPLAIDARGTVVGKTVHTNRADYYEDGAWTPLKSLGAVSSAEAINSSGVIAGEDGSKPVRWHHGHRMVLDGLGLGNAAGISDDGTIVGTYTHSHADHCFAWKDGAITDLGSLGGGSCLAYAIDPTGQYIGGMSSGLRFAGHAFISDAQGMHDLGTLQHGYFSQVRAVNRHGHASLSSDVDHSGNSAAAYWSGHRLIEVPGVRLPGGDSVPGGINSHDEMLVVGDNGSGTMIYLYEARTKTVTAIVPRIVNADGWCFCGGSWSQLAAGITDDGRIVGSAQLDGKEHGYMLVPVAP